jgi:hypothetical protein
VKREAIGLKRPFVDKPLDFDSESGAYHARWEFPLPRFTDNCSVALCRSPDAADRHVLGTVTREAHARAGGGHVFHLQGNYAGYRVIVWAVIDIGVFGRFPSEPLDLGQIGRNHQHYRWSGWWQRLLNLFHE